jgi:hypothetical protein
VRTVVEAEDASQQLAFLGGIDYTDRVEFIRFDIFGVIRPLVCGANER